MDSIFDAKRAWNWGTTLFLVGLGCCCYYYGYGYCC